MHQLEGSQERARILSTLPFIFGPSTDWVRPTHIREGNLLYSVYPLKVSLIQKHPHRHSQNKCLMKYLGIPWPSQVDTYNEPSQRLSLVDKCCTLN